MKYDRIYKKGKEQKQVDSADEGARKERMSTKGEVSREEIKQVRAERTDTTETTRSTMLLLKQEEPGYLLSGQQITSLIFNTAVQTGRTA